MTRLVTLLVALLLVSACGGGGSDQFEQADSDEFFEWCVEHRMNSATDSWQCDQIADLLGVDINEKGLEKDCAIRLVKRAIVEPPKPTEFTSGRDDWPRYPLPFDVNVSLGKECRTGSDLPAQDPNPNQVPVLEALTCSDLSLGERKAGVRIGKYYETSAYVLIDPDIVPDAFNFAFEFFDWEAEPLFAEWATVTAMKIDEAVVSLCPQQTSVVSAFSEWLNGLDPEGPDRGWIAATTVARADD